MPRNIFSYKQKMRKFVANRTAMQGMLKEILQIEKKLNQSIRYIKHMGKYKIYKLYIHMLFLTHIHMHTQAHMNTPFKLI